MESLGQPSADLPWACAECGTGALHPPGTTAITCTICSGVTEFRRCPKCSTGLSVSPRIRSMRRASLRCANCGEEGHRKHFPSVGIEHVPLPQGFVDAYANLGMSFAECAGYSGRRSLHGGLIGSAGVGSVGIGSSNGVSLYFEAMTLVACVGTMSNAGCIPLADLTSLSLVSRADFLASAGADPQGSLAASVAGSLATREPKKTETICDITWDDGGIVVLNQTMGPAEANKRFDVVLHRAYRAHSDAKDSMLDQFARLVLMNDTGMISHEEYQAESSRTFGTGN